MSSNQFVQLKLKSYYFVRIIRNSTVHKMGVDEMGVGEMAPIKNHTRVCVCVCEGTADCRSLATS